MKFLKWGRGKIGTISRLKLSKKSPFSKDVNDTDNNPLTMS